MTPIADPMFYAFAVPAVIMVGLAKGGFGGVDIACNAPR